MKDILDYFTNPSLGPFGAILSKPIGILISAVWFICLVWAVVSLVIGIAKLNGAKNQYQADKMATAKDELSWPVVSIIGLLAVPAIIAIFPQLV